MFDPMRPYNELPLLPPPVELETKPVLKACIAANRALAELKAAGDTIPNPEILIHALPLQEAKMSSEIENIVTTTDQLFQAESTGREDHDPATKEVLRYRHALRHGFELLRERPLGVNLFNTICGDLRDLAVDVRQHPGTVLQHAASGETIYTPPTGEETLRQLLGNLETFIHNEQALDPLVVMTVSHYQFEAIHPYTDGNGRTGRILMVLLLVEQGLLRLPVLFISHFILRHKAEYYARIRGVTERQEWEPWLLFMLEAIRQTATRTTEKIMAIRQLFADTCARIRQDLPQLYSKELVEALFLQPYCKIPFLVERGIAKRQTASSYLHQLATRGILHEIKVGRDRYFINHALVTTLKAGLCEA